MNNKNVRGILALAVVTALSFGVIFGSRALSKDNGGDTVSASDVKVLEELDTAGAENIEKAVKTEDGYMVTVKAKGYYGGSILMNVYFDETAQKLTKVEVTEQSETEGVGSLIAEADFLSQFEGVAAPVYLPGMSLGNTAAVDAAEMTLRDGTYEAKTTEADNNGFIDVVTMTVADGKITEVVWDCVDAEGNKKSVLSENGEYVMTEDGLTWKEQAEALGAAVVAGQSLNALGMNEEGKTDTVSGVSIYIGGFAALAEDCLTQAADVQPMEALEGEEAVTDTEEAAPQNGTQVDAVSGATISSTAAVTGINNAYNFLQSAK